MVKRFAAHRIVLPDTTVLPLHYIELDGHNRWQGAHPLEKEVASTAFYNGSLYVVREEDSVRVYHSERSDVLPAELGASDGRGHGDIQRLC